MSGLSDLTTASLGFIARMSSEIAADPHNGITRAPLTGGSQSRAPRGRVDDSSRSGRRLNQAAITRRVASMSLQSGSSSVDADASVANSLTVEPSSGSSTKMDVSDHTGTGTGGGGLIDDQIVDHGEEDSFSGNNSEEKAEMADVLGEMGLSEDQLKEIEQSKRQGMFVSASEDDETGVDAKDLGDPREQFLTAAEEGQVDTLSLMLGINPEYVKAVDKDNYTALHRAAYNDHVETVRLLLESGANPESRTSKGWTVLHSASARGNFEVVGVLLSHGVEVNALANGHLHALHLAVSSQEDPEKVFHTVRYLLQPPGVDPGDEPLVLARRNKRVEKILKMYADSEHDERGKFLLAAQNGDLDTVNNMLGINSEYVKAADPDGYTALHRAAHFGHLQVVKTLLHHGADTEARSKGGWTAIHSAAAFSKFDVVAVLINNEANAGSITFEEQMHSLHLTIQSTQEDGAVFETLRVILNDSGEGARVQSKAGDTPLALARKLNRSAQVTGLLQVYDQL